MTPPTLGSRPRIYVSGPIANTPDYQENFAIAAEELEAEGWYPVLPTWLQAEPLLDIGEYMRIDLLMELTCEAIYMLRGWENSTGAKVEHAVAVSCRLEILEQGA